MPDGQDDFPVYPRQRLVTISHAGAVLNSRAMYMLPRTLRTALPRRLDLIHHLPDSIHQHGLHLHTLLVERLKLFLLLHRLMLRALHLPPQRFRTLLSARRRWLGRQPGERGLSFGCGRDAGREE